MRDIILLVVNIFLFIMSSNSFAQDKVDSIYIDRNKYNYVDELRKYYYSKIDTNNIGFVNIVLPGPEPIGGISGIQSSLIYPEEAKLNNVEGYVYVVFTVKK